MILENQTQTLSLEAIVAKRVRALIRRFTLNPDWIIGLIGYRGSGKSLGGANIAIRDWGMSTAKLWSNMKMKLTIDVEDEVAGLYGTRGGSVIYEANPIDRNALLRLDSRYEGGLIFLDEINLEYGEARRSSSNVNLSTDTLIQQLRKLQCGLIFTAIDPMFVDKRIREATDVFIECVDTALYSYNMALGKPQGHEFEWKIYDMSGKMLGQEHSYRETNQGVMTYKVTLNKMWGVIDTYERQASNGVKYTDMGKTINAIDVEESLTVQKVKSQWSWLQDKILAWKQSGIKTIEAGELPMLVGAPLNNEIKQWLSVFGVSWSNYDQCYKVNDFSLEKPLPRLVPA
jgi:hypothetical protein